MSENNLMNRKDELIERIDSMQKFMEDYSQITMDMQKCVEKSVRFQQELIEWFGKELQSIKEQEELYLESITKEVEVAYTAKQIELKEAAQEVAATAAMAAKEAEELLNGVTNAEEPAAKPVVEEAVIETVEEPAAEEATEPETEPVAEEVIEPEAEPVAEEAIEPEEVPVTEEASSDEAPVLEEEPVAEPVAEATVQEPEADEDDEEEEVAPKQVKKAKAEKKPGFFARLFGKKEAKAAKAAREAEKTTETLAALTALSEKSALEPITAATAAGLAIGGALTEEEEKHLARLQKAPKPYVGNPVKSYPRDGSAPIDPPTEKKEEPKTIEEIITPGYEKIDIPETAGEVVKTDEEILAENEAIVDKYEAEMTPEQEAAAILAAQGVEFEEVPEVEEEPEEDYFAEVPAKEEVKAEPVVEEEEEEIDYFAEEEPVKVAPVKAAPSNAEEEEEIDYFAEEEPVKAEEKTAAIEEEEAEAEPVVEEPVAEEEEDEVKPYQTEEGRAQIDDIKNDHAKEAAATDRLIDNMYRRHREDMTRLCDELNIDPGMFDGYGDGSDIPEGEEYERLASMIEAHNNEKKTIEDLKNKMEARHEAEAKELCAQLKLSYNDYLNNNY